MGRRMVVGILDADALDDRVDLDGVDTADPVAQRVVDVIAGPRADDEFILERRAAGASLEQVDQRIGRPALIEGHHRLVSDIVNRDAEWHVVVDRVIGRPEGFMPVARPVGVRQRDRHQQRDQRQAAKPGQSADLTEQIGDAGAADEEPDRRRRLNERNQRKHSDADEASANV